jgi:hypothetical protein
MSTPEIKTNEGLKGLINRRAKKKIKFLDVDIEIYKLTVAQVVEIQEQAKKATDDVNGLELLKTVIKLGAEGSSSISDEDFANFPIDDLSKLSNEIMKFSGLTAPSETGK